ncbi:unnamed protein product, partial [Brenthis ino]
MARCPPHPARLAQNTSSRCTRRPNAGKTSTVFRRDRTYNFRDRLIPLKFIRVHQSSPTLRGQLRQTASICST